MIHNDEPITKVQTPLGHSSPGVTLNVYSHVLPVEGTGAARRLDQLIGFEVPPAALGSKTVAPERRTTRTSSQVVDLLVAKDGIEPPIQGFSVRTWLT